MTNDEQIKQETLAEYEKEIKTNEQLDEEISKKAKRKIGMYLIVIPVVSVIIIILAKTTYRYFNYQPSTVATSEVKEKRSSKLDVDDDKIWKTKSELEQNKIKKDVNELKINISNLDKEVKSTKEVLTKELQKQQKENRESFESLENIVTSNNRLINNKLKSTKDYVDRKIVDVKGEMKTNTNLKLTKLDPNKLLPFGEPSKKTDNILEEEKDTKEEVVEYIDIDINDNLAVSTMSRYEEKVIKKKPKSFIMDAGFGKATILAAGQFNTTSEAEDNRVPVFLSLDSVILTANGEEVDLKGCMIRGTGKGDLSSGKVPIAITKIDCKMNDEEANYRISENVKGVIYDESGGYALKGRMITKDGEVFAKAIPIALLETGLSLLQSKVESDNNRGDIFNLGQSAGNGFAKTGDTVVQKMGDRWLEYLDSLHPKIDVRPGRQVVVAFYGGEELNIKKYIPADLENFEKGLLDEVNIEDQTTQSSKKDNKDG